MKLTSAALAALLAVTAACGLFAPSENLYRIGVAKIGDQYHVLAPLCADERIAAVQVIDNRPFVEGEGDYTDADELRDTWWMVEDPTVDAAAKGEITLGVDTDYRAVVVPAGSRGGFPELANVQVRINDARDGHQVGEVFNERWVPVYPAGTDLATVKYGFDLGSNNETLLDAAGIRAEVKLCAREHTA